MCEHSNTIYIQAKCSDMCFLTEYINGEIVFEHDGYVPDGYDIGSGDYIEFSFCKDCKSMI